MALLRLQSRLTCNLCHGHGYEQTEDGKEECTACNPDGETLREHWRDEMSEELKPCPFCGSAPIEDRIEPHKHEFVTWMPDYPGSWSIECVACEFRLFDHDNRENVVKAWNRRAAPSSAQAETDHLLSNPANAAHLARSIEQARNGQMQERQLVGEAGMTNDRKNELVELLATLLHFIPGDEKDLYNDTEVFCVELRNETHRAALAAAPSGAQEDTK